ncbi:MAG: helix-turn-helix domain-containing protein [Planctomycetes bacterium]|nr:helix-turn-helix domain-containing protein [Planctomycetota bacterium]HPF15391.1 helix-turn-helix domain-containing protein [Planctomycetota bacterium]HRV79987.1 helix-turn-helix domain-containing protein [Planctomycetota bacterium]
MKPEPQPEILNIDQAASLLGVSLKTFHKVLHSEQVPARKIGREWKFSRQALIDWVGSGCSIDFYRGESADPDLVRPTPPPRANRARRTAGWQLEMD